MVIRQQHPEPVAALLAASVSAMRQRADTARAGELANDLESIRRLALANGYGSVLPVIHALDHVLSRSTRPAPIDGWLTILDDAVGCGRDDPRAEAAFAALCSVRLGC